MLARKLHHGESWEAFRQDPVGPRILWRCRGDGFGLVYVPRTGSIAASSAPASASLPALHLQIQIFPITLATRLTPIRSRSLSWAWLM